jgi:hypothetical protein
MNEMLNIVKTRLITTKEDLLSLVDSWNLLHKEVNGTIFQTFEWNASWWDIYAQKNFQLCVFTVWNDSQLIGILPLFQETFRFGAVTFSRLRFLASTETYGEYLPLVHPDFEHEVLKEMVNFCAERIQTKKCDMVSVFRFPSTSEFMKNFLTDIKTAGLRVRYVPNWVPRVMMELPDSWESYLNIISPNEKLMLVRRSRVLTKQGVELEVVQDSSLRETDYNDFVRLHKASWNVRNQSSYFSSNKFESFQRSIMSQFRKDKIARLYYFKKDGVRFAAVQAYFMNGICHFYLSGLDRQHSLVHQSPGKILLSLVIKDAIENGYKIFDFHGGVEDYKYRLGGKRASFGKADIWKPGINSLRVFMVLMYVSLRHLLADQHFIESAIKPLKNLVNKLYSLDQV